MRTGFRWAWSAFYAVVALTVVQASEHHTDTGAFFVGLALEMAPVFLVLLAAQRWKLGFWNPLRVFRRD